MKEIVDIFILQSYQQRWSSDRSGMPTSCCLPPPSASSHSAAHWTQTKISSPVSGAVHTLCRTQDICPRRTMGKLRTKLTVLNLLHLHRCKVSQFYLSWRIMTLIIPVKVNSLLWKICSTCGHKFSFTPISSLLFLIFRAGFVGSYSKILNDFHILPFLFFIPAF